MITLERGAVIAWYPRRSIAERPSSVEVGAGRAREPVLDIVDAVGESWRTSRWERGGEDGGFRREEEDGVFGGRVTSVLYGDSLPPVQWQCFCFLLFLFLFQKNLDPVTDYATCAISWHPTATSPAFGSSCTTRKQLNIVMKKKTVLTLSLQKFCKTTSYFEILAKK